MELQKHYNRLWKASVADYYKGNTETDKLLDADHDSRFGITVVIRPEEKILRNISHMLQDLQLVEPSQYYYPPSDVHITVMSVISCYQGFSLENIKTEAYQLLLKDITKSISSFHISFRGITASPSCVMVQGFPEDESLEELRKQIRLRFKASGLQQSMDTRYTIQTAHCTVLRFRNPLTDPAAFTAVLESYRTIPFGRTAVNQVELVYNDWYQRKAKVQQLGVYPLK